MSRHSRLMLYIAILSSILFFVILSICHDGQRALYKKHMQCQYPNCLYQNVDECQIAQSPDIPQDRRIQAIAWTAMFMIVLYTWNRIDYVQKNIKNIKRLYPEVYERLL